MFNKILDATNQFVTATIGTLTGRKGIDGVPIGLSNSSEIGVKVVVVGDNTAATDPTYTLDSGPSWTTSLGVAGARFTSADQSAAVASVTDAPTTGQKIVLTDILFSSDTALRMDFSEETSGTILFSVYTSAGSSGQFTPRGKCKLATANKKLQVRTSAAGNIAVTPLYYSEA